MKKKKILHCNPGGRYWHITETEVLCNNPYDKDRSLGLSILSSAAAFHSIPFQNEGGWSEPSQRASVPLLRVTVGEATAVDVNTQR